MKLSRKEIKSLLTQWHEAWTRHDLESIMTFFDDDIFFEHWTGAYVKGRKSIRRAWEPWFANHGNFRFIKEEIFIDEQVQKALYRWVLEWPSTEPGFEGKPELRRGVDVIHFRNGKILNKLTYTKTTIEIDNKRHLLHI